MRNVNNCFSFKTVRIRVVLSFRTLLVAFEFEEDNDEEVELITDLIDLLDEIDTVVDDDEEDPEGRYNGILLFVAKYINLR